MAFYGNFVEFPKTAPQYLQAQNFVLDIVALTLRPDGSIAELFDRFRALIKPWIENASFAEVPRG